MLLQWLLFTKPWSKATRDAALLITAWAVCRLQACIKQSYDISLHQFFGTQALFLAGLVLDTVKFSEGFIHSLIITDGSAYVDPKTMGG